MDPAEQSPLSPAEQIPFDVQVNEVNASLADRVPSFDEFTAARTLADQMDFDKQTGTYTAPDGSFVDSEQATQLRHLASESTWLLNDAQELALLKARGAVDDTLRQKAVSSIDLDQSIRRANKEDAKEHQESLRQERLALLEKKDNQRLDEIKQQQLATIARDRTKELLWKTAFENGGTRLHGKRPEMQKWVHDIAERKAIGEMLDKIAVHPEGETIAKQLDELAVQALQKEKADKLSPKASASDEAKPAKAPVVKAKSAPGTNKNQSRIVSETPEAKRRRVARLAPRIAQLLRADLEATNLQERARKYARRAA